MDALASIQPALQTGALATQIGSTGYGMYNQYENNKYLNYLRGMAQNPAEMNAYASQYEQPLAAGLTQGVGNNTQAYLAQRGLTESPQISQEVESQAIAPYIEQQQQDAYNIALQALGLGKPAVSNQMPSNVAGLANAFSKLSQLNQPGSVDPNQMIQMLTAQQITPGIDYNPPAPPVIDTSSLDSSWNASNPFS